MKTTCHWFALSLLLVPACKPSDYALEGTANAGETIPPGTPTVGPHTPPAVQRLDASAPLPPSVLVDAAHSLFVDSDSAHNVVRVGGPTSVAPGSVLGTFVPSGSGGLTWPKGLAFGPDHNLYVADYLNNRILKYDGTTGAFLSVFAGPNTVLQGGQNSLYDPTDLKFAPAPPGVGGAQLWVGSDVFSVFNIYNAATGGTPVFWANTANGITLHHPLSIAVSAARDTFIWDGGPLIHIQPSTFAWSQTTPFPGNIISGDGFVFGPDGNLYMSNGTGGYDCVYKLSPTTGQVIGTFVTTGSGGLSNPRGIAFGPDGNLYVCSTGNNKVMRYNGTTGAPLGAGGSTTDATYASGIPQPRYIAFP